MNEKIMKQYMKLRMDSEMKLIKTEDFSEQEIFEDGRADLSIIYARITADIINKHGLISKSDEFYSNYEYPKQKQITLNTCEDGFKFLLEIYHYEENDGYTADVFANGDDNE